MITPEEQIHGLTIYDEESGTYRFGDFIEDEVDTSEQSKQEEQT